MLESCDGRGGVPHPDVVRPEFPWVDGDWLGYDPMGDVRSHPLWYAPDLIDDIRSRNPSHEIGSHSFAHLPFGEAGCTRQAADSDLAAAASAAERLGLHPRVFVYPRHSVEFVDLLASHGFTAFRGDAHEPFLGLSPSVRKPLRLAARALGAGMRPKRPNHTEEGLVDLPASMFFSLPEGRAGRAITTSSLVRACKRGIGRAAQTGSVFQLYFHDHNMGVRTEEFFAAIEAVLSFASDARTRGELEVSTFSTCVARLTPGVGRPHALGNVDAG
jgi:hypothetical protein